MLIDTWVRFLWKHKACEHECKHDGATYGGYHIWYFICHFAWYHIWHAIWYHVPTSKCVLSPNRPGTQTHTNIQLGQHELVFWLMQDSAKVPLLSYAGVLTYAGFCKGTFVILLYDILGCLTIRKCMSDTVSEYGISRADFAWCDVLSSLLRTNIVWYDFWIHYPEKVYYLVIPLDVYCLVWFRDPVLQPASLPDFLMGVFPQTVFTLKGFSRCCQEGPCKDWQTVHAAGEPKLL